jgi:hypothetical protein
VKSAFCACEFAVVLEGEKFMTIHEICILCQEAGSTILDILDIKKQKLLQREKKRISSIQGTICKFDVIFIRKFW